MRLAYDPEGAVAALSACDKRLAKLIAQVGPLTLEPEKLQSPLEALAKAIIYQQLSGKAAATIYGRVIALFPEERGLEPGAILAMPDEAFRSAGMSWAKIAAIKDLAAKTLDGTVPGLAQLKRMSDEEIVARLVSVRGIGPWTVEMLLIFRLGRGDVLPVSDLGVRKGFMLTYKKPALPTAKELTAYAERWRPYRSVASWYLWRAVDLHSAAKQPASTGNVQAAAVTGTIKKRGGGRSTAL